MPMPRARESEQLPARQVKLEVLVSMLAWVSAYWLLLLGDRLVEIEDRRATVVHAASSAASSRASRGDSPTATSLAAAAAILAERVEAAARGGFCSTPVSLPRRLARGRQAEGVGDARSTSSAPPSSRHALRQRPRRLDVGRVVHQHQRLQRRVGAARAAPCTSRGRGRRTSPATAAAPSASRTCTSRGGTDPARGSARTSAPRSPRRMPSPPRARPAGRAARSGRRSCRSAGRWPPARCRGSISAGRRNRGPARQQPVLRIALAHRAASPPTTAGRSPTSRSAAASP